MNGFEISPKMKQINNLLLDNMIGIPYCLSKKGENLIVEVPKNHIDVTISILKGTFRDVVDIKKAYLMIDDLHDFIFVKPLVSESPIMTADGVFLPSPEKQIVDLCSDRENTDVCEESLQKEFQRAFEINEINIKRLVRYAGRKGEKDEIQNRIERLDKERIRIFGEIRSFCETRPIEKAWVFGSFSRMEERKDSDIDILVTFDKTSPIGLMQYSEMIIDLERLLSRKVDLVQDDSVKPFARKSIDQNKILVYERA